MNELRNFWHFVQVAHASSFISVSTPLGTIPSGIPGTGLTKSHRR
jgi:hypothetical protein